MPISTEEAVTPILDTPVKRSTFLYYGALLLASVGLGRAHAHSGISQPEVASDAGSASKSGRALPGSGFKQKTYRHSRKLSDRFPNTLLYTHENKALRFYDDLVKNKTVIIDFMWASCDDDCPLKTSNLANVYKRLGHRVGQDILMLSISLEGHGDTPAALQQYMNRYGGSKPGWIYLTGDYDEVEAIRYSLGVYDLDPVIDADRESHAGIITFGNDQTNRWAALPALMSSRGIARTVSRITRGSARTS